MPRKPFERQAGFLYKNKTPNYMLNQSIKHCKSTVGRSYHYHECWSELGLFPRNTDMKPLIHNGKKAR